MSVSEVENMGANDTIKVLAWDDTHKQKLENLPLFSLLFLKNVYVKEYKGQLEIHVKNESSFMVITDNNRGFTNFHIPLILLFSTLTFLQYKRTI
jgi:hypothetical protein